MRRLRARLAAMLARLAGRLDGNLAESTDGDRPARVRYPEVHSIDGQSFVSVESRVPPGAMRLTMDNDGKVGAQPVPAGPQRTEMAELMIAALEGDAKAHAAVVAAIEALYVEYEFDGGNKRHCPYAASLERILGNRHDPALLDGLTADESAVITRVVDHFAGPRRGPGR